MVTHIVLMRWRADADADRLAGVPAVIDRYLSGAAEVRSFRHGPDLGLGADRFDYAAVVERDDADAFRAFHETPANDEMRELFGQLLASSASIELDLA